MARVDFKFAALPAQWPRPESERRRGLTYFKAGYGVAVQRLSHEVERLDPRGPVIIQADYRERDIRLDGLPRGDARQPEFPGVIVHITSNHRGQLRFLCDDCLRWYHNIHAIALTLERLRLTDIYGVTRDGEQYKGWRGLPAPEHADMTTLDQALTYVARHAYPDVTNHGNIAANIRSDSTYARSAYRAAAARLHPDGGGTVEQWQLLQGAWGLIEPMHSARTAQ